MPLRVLQHKTPVECLFKSNDYVVSPKVFGCVCFVHDYRSNVGKLDPRAVKCVFVGYSPSQKGYRCWRPSERRFFVSMDVTFREHEPYYCTTNDTGISLSPPEVQQEGESNSGGTPIGTTLVPTSEASHYPSEGYPGEGEEYSSEGEEINDGSGGDNSNPCGGDMQDATGNSSTPSHGVELHEDPGANLHTPSPVAPGSTTSPGDNQLPTPDSQTDLQLLLENQLEPQSSRHALETMSDIKTTMHTFLTNIVARPSKVLLSLLILYVYLLTGKKLKRIRSGRKQCLKR